MRRILASLALATLAAGFLVSSAAASTPSPVSGSYAIADLGQGGWGGGPLYANGSVGGSGALSFANGQVIGHVTGGTWSFAGATVNICVSLQQTKGPAGAFPPSPLCFDGLVPGKPVVVPDAPNTLFKVTLTG